MFYLGFQHGGGGGGIKILGGEGVWGFYCGLNIDEYMTSMHFNSSEWGYALILLNEKLAIKSFRILPLHTLHLIPNLGTFNSGDSNGLASSS